MEPVWETEQLVGVREIHDEAQYNTTMYKVLYYFHCFDLDQIRQGSFFLGWTRAGRAGMPIAEKREDEELSDVQLS